VKYWYNIIFKISGAGILVGGGQTYGSSPSNEMMRQLRKLFADSTHTHLEILALHAQAGEEVG